MDYEDRSIRNSGQWVAAECDTVKAEVEEIYQMSRRWWGKKYIFEIEASDDNCTLLKSSLEHRFQLVNHFNKFNIRENPGVAVL